MVGRNSLDRPRERTVTSAANLELSGRAGFAALPSGYALVTSVDGASGGLCGGSTGGIVAGVLKEQEYDARAAQYGGSGCSSPTHDGSCKPDDLEEDEEEMEHDDGEDAPYDPSRDSPFGAPQTRAASRGAGAGRPAGGVRKPKGKKKLGRPASFNEDEIDWDTLSQEERRKIRRRLSNRASAHRVRQRRTEMMTGLHNKINSLQQQNATALTQLAASDARRKALISEMQVVKERWSSADVEVQRLQAENAALRAKLQEHNIPAPLPSAACSEVNALPAGSTMLPPASLALLPDSRLPPPVPLTAAGLQGIGSGLEGQHASGLGGISSLASSSHYGMPPSMSFSAAHDPAAASGAPGVLSPAGSLGLLAPGPPLQLGPSAFQLDRSSTLSFGLGDLENAPSLGLASLTDLGLVGSGALP